MIDSNQKFSGWLFYPLRRSDFWSVIQSANITTEIIEIQPGWFSFMINPESAWEEMELSGDEHSEPFKGYRFLIRLGGHGRFMLASTKNNWVKRLFQDLGMSNLLNNTPTVAISALLDDLRKTPRVTDYALGAIYARIEGYGQALRTIILYGDDIASAPLFNDHIVEQADPYRLVLRKTRWHEVLSIGDRADLSFDFKGIDSLVEIDAAIRVIGKELGHLDWGVD